MRNRRSQTHFGMTQTDNLHTGMRLAQPCRSQGNMDCKMSFEGKTGNIQPNNWYRNDSRSARNTCLQRRACRCQLDLGYCQMCLECMVYKNQR